MKKFKKLAAVVFSFCLVMALLTGCGGPKNLEEYLDDEAREELAEELGDDISVEISGNEMTFKADVDDEGIEGEDFDSLCELMDESMEGVLEEQFESVLEDCHDESGIEDAFTVNFEIYGSESGKLIWEDSYTK